MKNKVFIIAEAGVNHNGDVECAEQLILAAKKAGADAVKFQTFKADQIVAKNAEKADYQKSTTGKEENQRSMLEQLELSYESFSHLKQTCDNCGILFLSTAFDLDSIEFLETLKMPLWKIPSGEITNLPYLLRIAQTKKPVILSTGMANMKEIGDAVQVLKENGTAKLSLLHCNTEYPTPMKDVNLRAMDTLKRTFDVEVGYSDHTEGIEVSIAAVARGASIIEKHFTLDRSMIGPDHKASLDPESLKQMVVSIRNIEIALGSDQKVVSSSEAKNIKIARKSIVAKKAIKAGELFSTNNITTKRPGNGISPMSWFEILGTYAKRDFEEDELIEL